MKSTLEDAITVSAKHKKCYETKMPTERYCVKNDNKLKTKIRSVIKLVLLAFFSTGNSFRVVFDNL